MKRLLSFLAVAALTLLVTASCTKHSGTAKDPFKGIWYVKTISEIGAGETITVGTGEEYWEFKKNGTVLIHDTTIPELGGGAAPKPFSYNSETRMLRIDAFDYEVLSANSSELGLRSRFSPEVWSSDTYLVISFQRTRKGLSQ